jgi:hypothetical protein
MPPPDGRTQGQERGWDRAPAMCLNTPAAELKRINVPAVLIRRVHKQQRPSGVADLKPAVTINTSNESIPLACIRPPPASRPLRHQIGQKP